MRLHLARLAAALARPVRSRPEPGTLEPAPDPEPVEIGGRRVRQVDGTTCGAAVLLLLEACGDPALARALEADPGLIDSRQLDLHAKAAHRGLGILPWPRFLGTTPWALAGLARFPGVTYQARAVDDTDASARAILAWVWHATRAGIPVPLYSGGDTSVSLASAVPRHVVLAEPSRRPDATLTVYEPSTGTRHVAALDELLGRTRPHPALGNWTHVVWAILPTKKGTP